MPSHPASATWTLAVADIGGVPPALLEDVGRLEALFDSALGDAMDWVRHEYSPRGASLVGISSRLRVAVHTWPESAACTVDVWSAADSEVNVARLVEVVGWCARSATARDVSAHASNDAAE